MSASEEAVLKYQPGGWFYREALRLAADDSVKLRAIARMLLAEYEEHRRFIRAGGEWPPQIYDPPVALADVFGHPIQPLPDNQLAFDFLTSPCLNPIELQETQPAD